MDTLAAPSRRRRTRRIRRLALVLVTVAATLLLASCTGQRDPDKYTDGVRNQFTRACWTQLLLDANGTKVADDDSLETKSEKAEDDAEEGQVADAQDYCRCVFAAIREDVPFSEFKSANDDLRSEGGKLPSSITKAYASCDEPTL